MGSKEQLVQQLIVTAEVCGTELSKPAAALMAIELSRFPADAVANALRKCQRELTGRLTLAAVLSRVALADGRPSADEAWAIAGAALDEGRTLVWTEDMAEAYGAARELHIAGDGIAARMAFRSAYDRIVQDARSENVAARWVISIGSDSSRRGSAVLEAVERGRITTGQARMYLSPDLPDWDLIERRLLKAEGKPMPAIAQGFDARALLAQVGRKVQS